MTTTTTTPAATTEARLNQARNEVLAEMGRADAKASALLTVLGLPLTVLIAAVPGKGLPTAALVLVGLGALGLSAAMAMALLVIRPRLGGSPRGSYLHWATCAGAEGVTTDLAEGHSADHVALMSRMVLRKYRTIRRAIDTTAAALGALLLALLTALTLA